MTIKWKRSDCYSILYDEDNCDKTILSILKLQGNEYQINLDCLHDYCITTADSMAYAEWYAVNYLYNCCNREANYYHNIRDHLPSIHDLAVIAGI